MRLVPDPLLDVGELLGPTAAALWVDGWAVGVAAALELGEDVLGLGLGEAVVGLGLGEEVGLGLGEEVGALGLGEDVVAVRLGDKLAIALWIAPPQPAVRHTATMAAKRKKLCV
jgi:hypothetical protein